MINNFENSEESLKLAATFYSTSTWQELAQSRIILNQIKSNHSVETLIFYEFIRKRNNQIFTRFLLNDLLESIESKFDNEPEICSLFLSKLTNISINQSLSSKILDFIDKGGNCPISCIDVDLEKARNVLKKRILLLSKQDEFPSESIGNLIKSLSIITSTCSKENGDHNNPISTSDTPNTFISASDEKEDFDWIISELLPKGFKDTVFMSGISEYIKANRARLTQIEFEKIFNLIKINFGSFNKQLRIETFKTLVQFNVQSINVCSI